MNAKHPIRVLGRILGRLLASARGSVAVELGLLAPVAAVMLVGMFEFTGAYEQGMDLATAARAGAQYAIIYPTDTTGIQNAVIDSGAISPTNLTVTVKQFCECPDGTSITCTSTCSGGVQNDVYMQVALSQPAKSLLTSTGLMSGRTVSASATLRMR